MCSSVCLLPFRRVFLKCRFRRDQLSLIHVVLYFSQRSLFSMSNVNNNVEFFIDASKVSEPSESAHVSENDTSSRRKGLVSFVKTNPDSPPFKPGKRRTAFISRNVLLH